MKTKKVKISELKIDPKLTEIRHINLVFVSRYRQAYRSGANMPLMIVEEPTNRIVSGNHRYNALLQEYGEEYTMEVEARSYSNEAEVLLDFAKENAIHGSPMDTYTRTKLRNAMLIEGVTAEQIASIFNISVRRLENLGDGIVQVELKGGKVEERPVKRGFESEKPITEKQYKEHDAADRGFTVIQQANQLTRWLRDKLVKRTGSNLTALQELKKALDAFLRENTSKAA